MTDPVNHPKHYTSHPSGVECIAITEHMTFNLGNAIKYIWRAGDKDNAVQDLQKAVWYLQREIDRIHLWHLEWAKKQRAEQEDTRQSPEESADSIGIQIMS